jgi:hypothetical protein
MTEMVRIFVPDALRHLACPYELGIARLTQRRGSFALRSCLRGMRGNQMHAQRASGVEVEKSRVAPGKFYMQFPGRNTPICTSLLKVKLTQIDV